MRRANTLQMIVILFLIISCADRHLEEQEKEASHPRAIGIQGGEQPKLSPEGGETKNYVPGEILVKFRDGTKEKAIEAIKTDLHLETVRIVSKPNLYLMRILDGSSVENVLERLRQYKEVKYSEPNYVRTTN